MKKRFSYVLLLLIGLILIPGSVYGIAGGEPVILSDSSGETSGGTTNIIPYPKGWWYDCGGVRITFIDQDGNALSGSYDFSTSTTCKRNTAYNKGTHDKSKKTGNTYDFQTINVSSLPKLTDLYNKMNELFGSGNSEYANGYTIAYPSLPNDYPGNGINGFDNESEWFKSITSPGLAPNVFKANVNAFIDAIKNFYPGFDGDSLKLKMNNSCNSDTEVFIQMEPMMQHFDKTFLASDDEIKNSPECSASCRNSTACEECLKGRRKFSHYDVYVFGTVNDIYEYYKSVFDERKSMFSDYSTRVNEYKNNFSHPDAYSTSLDHSNIWNINKLAYQMYYQTPLLAPNFTAYDTVSLGGVTPFPNNRQHDVGWGVNLDWATMSTSYCGSCSFSNNTMFYDNAPILTSYSDINDDNLRKAIDPSYTGGYNCCYALTNDYNNNSLNPQWREAYNKYCNQTTPPSSSCRIDGDTYYCKNGEVCDVEQYDEECGNSDCCTNEPIEAGKLEGIVVNCCVENTHSYVKEYDLDELFCRHNTLRVDKYFEKCNTDEYINKDVELNDYCDMYCTERVTIDVPEAITAKSGRYFTLQQNPKGNTTSPYIEGYKRCRVRIKYNQWEADYIATVRKQIDEYNKYQEQIAYVESYNALIADTHSDSKQGTITCNASADVQYDDICYRNCQDLKDSDGNPIKDTNGQNKVSCESYSCTKTETAVAIPKTVNCSIDYIRHDVKNSFLKKIYNAKDEPVINSHSLIKVESLQTNDFSDFSSKLGSRTWVATDVNEEKCSKSAKEEETSVEVCGTHNNCTTVNYSCSYTYDLENQIDIVDIRNEYQFVANSFATKLQQYAKDAKALEEKLSTCNNYFDTEEGKPETMYDFDPSMTFRYSQIYRDDNGQSQLSVIDIPFMDEPGCTITGPETGEIGYDHGGKDTYPDRYSDDYGTGFMYATDFSGDNLHYAGNGSFDSMLDTTYNANKRFTHDARYKAVCEWKEDENQVNTLVPNGAVTDDAVANYTVHEREYKVYLTTYDGTFETDWSITNVGEKGKFDKFIQEQGTKTCAGSEVTEDNTFSCQLHVEYEIVYTGKCNGVTNNPDDCEPVNDINGLFAFKVVDETNLFPNDTTIADGSEVAKNWTATDKGKAAKEAIEENGRKGLTYDESKVTYKFHLTPATMRHIKNYNVTRNSNQRGGYSDFEMKCECPSEPQTNSAVEGVGCTKCKSNLLSDLANGVINYDGQSHNVNVWTANRSIDLVRSAMWR